MCDTHIEKRKGEGCEGEGVPIRINTYGEAKLDGGCKGKVFQYTQIYGEEKFDGECNWEGGLKRVHIYGEAKL